MKQIFIGIIVAAGLTLPAFGFDGTYSPANVAPSFKAAPLELPPDLMAQANLGGTTSVDPLIGTWKLNVEKSTSTRRMFKSLTLTFTGEGQNITLTVEGVDAQNRPYKGVNQHIYDGQPHPSTGDPLFDSSAYARIGNALTVVRFKDGKPVDVGHEVLTPGKTLTVTEDYEINGQLHHTVLVYDRQ